MISNPHSQTPPHRQALTIVLGECPDVSAHDFTHRMDITAFNAQALEALRSTPVIIFRHGIHFVISEIISPDKDIVPYTLLMGLLSEKLFLIATPEAKHTIQRIAHWLDTPYLLDSTTFAGLASRRCHDNQ